jgi:hypothetical protein
VDFFCEGKLNMLTEVTPDLIQFKNGQLIFTPALAHSGGGALGVGTEWCGYCNQLKKNVPMGQRLRPFDFFWLDAEKTAAHKAKVQQLGIRGYPTIYSIGRGGVLTEYEGGRTPEQLARNFSRR